MKKFFKKFGKKIALAGSAALAVCSTAVTAFAEDATSLADTMVSSVTSGASSAVSSVTGMLTTVAPYIIGIVVGIVVLYAGIKWVKKIRSNAA